MPVVEVVLQAPVEQLVERWRARALSPDAHPVRRKHKIGTEHRLLSSDYLPVAPDDRVVRVDATNVSGLRAERVAADVMRLLEKR